MTLHCKAAGNHQPANARSHNHDCPGVQWGRGCGACGCRCIAAPHLTAARHDAPPLAFLIAAGMQRVHPTHCIPMRQILPPPPQEGRLARHQAAWASSAGRRGAGNQHGPKKSIHSDVNINTPY